ncbi:hypothetical protein SteCoe_35983 [Stentor coeruleus]|uniref:Kinesin-like protein n=1 Tax=Stentor coeruleus TaxID=5963 RepID=A0A1R2ARC4_9CILI|nr:hypothetical protein SteCoe_35983 [Stentor coeruleus]
MEDTSSSGNIQVVCRVRPLNEKEFQRCKDLCVRVHEDRQTISINSSECSESLTFTFDSIFAPETPQQNIYEIAARPIITAVLEGFNGTILAYGQTSSGKTFTMTGDDSGNSTNIGIIPRIVNDLFLAISNAEDSLEFVVKISYCEIYLEKIKDLIDPTRNNLKIQEDKARGVFINDLTEYSVSNHFEVYELMKIGKDNREVGQTLMNESSSRSHTIFIITITQNNRINYSAKSGKLYLVDLAGSEKVGKTGAAGKRLEEAKNINKSLTTLGLVITALTDSKSTHVPYRDSKLTRVLQDSLGGNAKTTLILTCSPSPWNEEETISTLRFGTRAKAITNKPKVNREYTINELKLMLYAAKEEILKRDKIIESLRGEVNKHSEEEHSLSVVSFSNNEIIECMKEIEKLKENLNIENGKSMRLQLEANEKSALLERERKEITRFNSIILCQNQKIKALEDTIKIYESKLLHTNFENTSLKSELQRLALKCEKTELFNEELCQKLEEKNEKINTMFYQLQEYVILEKHNSNVLYNLNRERIYKKKLEEEIDKNRQDFKEMLGKIITEEQALQKIREVIESEQRSKWVKVRENIFMEFNKYIEGVNDLKSEVECIKGSVLVFQKSFWDIQEAMRRKMAELVENNRQLKFQNEKLNREIVDFCMQNQQECDKRLQTIIENRKMELQIASYKEQMQTNKSKLETLTLQISNSEHHLNFLNMQIKEHTSQLPELTAKLFGNIRKTIKGGKNIISFTPSPNKELTRTNSDSAIIEHREEDSCLSKV